MAFQDGMRLLLWDIDQTLIESPGVGQTVYERVFPQVTGVALRELAAVGGRTELDIMRDTLEQNGVEPTAEVLERLATALGEGFRLATDELVARGRVLPGVWRALARFGDEDNTLQGVLTGNTAEVARVKIEAFGLDRFLDLNLGGFGDDHHDRAELVVAARRRAQQHLGREFPGERVVLVGDTPNDVRAGVAAGAEVVGVATGRYSAHELAAAGAGIAVPTLADLPALHTP